MRRTIELFFPVLLLSFVASFASFASGQVVDSNGCDVDADVAPIPQCALEMRGGHLYIAHRYAWMFFAPGTEKLASAQLPDGWAYFNRSGRVVVRNVAGFANGASSFHHGLVRVVKDGKYGLANSLGTLVVPYKYDGMYEFDEAAGKGWLACTGCRAVADASGESQSFAGGKWCWLNRQGQVARRAEEPQIASTN